MSDSVDRVFVQALNTVKKLPRSGSARPPPSDRLKLYGLYKQSMEGNVEGVMRRPDGKSADEVAEQEKWDAWSSLHGISRTEAKRRYISTLIETMHKYASTTSEARELVTELEFVWDQIKSNSVSSTTSSPVKPLADAFSTPRSQRQPHPSYTSIGPGKAKPDRGGFKILKPIGDSDLGSGDDADDFEEAHDGRREPAALSLEAVANPLPSVSSREHQYEIRNRKWRKRIEQTLMKITTELAALREQIDAQNGSGTNNRRKGLWAWLAALVLTAARHLLIDAMLAGILILWIRGDERVRSALGVLIQVLKERIKRLGLFKRVDGAGR